MRWLLRALLRSAATRAYQRPVPRLSVHPKFALGHFGAHVAHTLYAAGRDLSAIDLDAEKAPAMADHAAQAVVADATGRTVLHALAERMDVITLAALHVIELGVPFVAVKALSEDHGRILTALGVHDVIHPEKDMAIRLANRLSRTDVVDFLPLLPGYSIIEIKAPPEFSGRTLRDLALRNTLNVQLVAIQHIEGGEKHINIVPQAGDRINEGDLLILLGENRDLDRIREIVKNPRRD